MPLRTAFTELFSLPHPIALAPMGGMSGGALAAAVSNAGGLGIIGGGREDPGWLERELQIVTSSTSKAWGVGFQSWATDAATLERALAYRPRAVMLSFGDPRPLVEAVRRAGAMLIVQVTDLDEARQALEVEADVIVAQGTEAGGHGGRRSTLPFVPVVVDLAAPVPVLAAGGIADGRGVAAALALGAAGALLGTRFLVCREALVPGYVPRRSSTAAVRIPSAAGSPTSPGGRPGRPSGQRGPCGIGSTTSGAAAKRNSRPTPRPGRPTKTRSRPVNCRPARYGPARPST